MSAGILTSPARSGKQTRLITFFTAQEASDLIKSVGDEKLLRDMHCRVLGCADWDLSGERMCCFLRRTDNDGLFMAHKSCFEAERARGADYFEIVPFSKKEFLDHLIDSLSNWKTPAKSRQASPLQGRAPVYRGENARRAKVKIGEGRAGHKTTYVQH